MMLASRIGVAVVLFVSRQPYRNPEKQTRQTAKSDIPVLLETNEVLVVCKPPGIAHHDSQDGQEKGILNLVRFQRQGPGFCRLYGVHRLDRVTSGILVLAKSSEIAGAIQKQFREGKTLKYYVGLSRQKAKKKQGLVEGHMIRGRRKSWYLTRDLPSGGQGSRAKTRFFSAGLGHLDSEAKTLLLFRPYTGKTHQLRVASKSVGLPLLGDTIYGNKAIEEQAFRTYLHACALHVPRSDVHESFSVACYPPFKSAWESRASRQGFDASFRTLLDKHCELNNLFGDDEQGVI